MIQKHIALVKMQDKNNANTFSDSLMNGLVHRFSEIENDRKIKFTFFTTYLSSTTISLILFNSFTFITALFRNADNNFNLIRSIFAICDWQ